MKLYHNPRCGKSREALKILTENGHEPEIVEYLKNPLSDSELAEIIKMLGIKPFDLIRTNEKVYKEQFKGKTLSDAEWISAMILHPKLMERPIIVSDGKALVGRPPELVMDIL